MHITIINYIPSSWVHVAIRGGLDKKNSKMLSELIRRVTTMMMIDRSDHVRIS